MARISLARDALIAHLLVIEFDWHDEKSEANLQERGFDFDFASRVFDDETIEFPDTRQSYGEARTIAFGLIEGDMYAVVYTQRGDVRWIISAFRCRQREVERWKKRGGAA